MAKQNNGHGTAAESSKIERVGDIAISKLATEGFDELTERQKNLIFHLGQAGLHGRAIALEQGSKHNIELISSMIDLSKAIPSEHGDAKSIHDALFALFAHSGLYHSTSGQRLDLGLTRDAVKRVASLAPAAVGSVERILFVESIPEFRTVQTDGVDVVAQSGGNFYDGLTASEVLAHRASVDVSVFGDKVPPFGFNQRLSKDGDGMVVAESVHVGGLYSEHVSGIVKHLELALNYVENDKQGESISTLMEFYKSGRAEDFDKHCVAWVADQDSSVYFINGLIESYEDPLGVGCTFESVVAFKNPAKTAKVNRIIDNIQWFEDQLPIEERFKKKKAQGLSASSITVVSMAGDASPSLPLGVNLPNSDWIRREHGSKSVNLENVASSRSGSEQQLREALYLPEYHEILEKWLSGANSLHTDLHEIAGHGSGQLAEGVSTDVLGAYYSTLEEARADLVALYFMADPALKDFGVVDQDVDVAQAAKAQYIGYITGGAFGQLRRVALGNDLTQAHFRNRQLIARWVLEHADSSKLAMVEKQGQVYIELNDVDHVRGLFGRLLAHVQAIKSTADVEGCKALVMEYGTKVDQGLHKATLARIENLDLPKVQGFVTPVLEQTSESGVVLSQPRDFLSQQIAFHEHYVLAPRKLIPKGPKV